MRRNILSDVKRWSPPFYGFVLTVLFFYSSFAGAGMCNSTPPSRPTPVNDYSTPVLQFEAIQNEIKNLSHRHCPGGDVIPDQATSRSGPLREVISEAEARVFFERLASSQSIPFRFPWATCQSRAHEMSRLLETWGVHSKKRFVLGGDGETGPLVVHTPWDTDGKVEWGMHVAPIVKVRKTNGAIVDLVFDPSIMDQPVPFEDWRSKMNKSSCLNLGSAGVANLTELSENETQNYKNCGQCLYYDTERFVYVPSDTRNPPTRWDQGRMNDACFGLKLGCRGVKYREKKLKIPLQDQTCKEMIDPGNVNISDIGYSCAKIPS